MTQPEKRLQSTLERDLPKLGLVVAHVNYTTLSPQGGHTTLGFPDLVIIGRDVVDLWELKSPTGRLNEHQRDFHSICERSGYTIPVIRSIDGALSRLGERFPLRLQGLR